MNNIEYVRLAAINCLEEQSNRFILMCAAEHAGYADYNEWLIDNRVPSPELYFMFACFILLDLGEEF